MPRLPFAIALILSVSSGPVAKAEEIPVIVTYELQKQRLAAHASARDPRSFWIRQVATRIEARASRLPKPTKAPVTVRVSFVIGRDGRLLSRTIKVPSGSEMADEAALAMLDRAQPFPPMPAAMSDTELAFTLPISFR